MGNIGSSVARIIAEAKENSKIKMRGFDPIFTKGFVMFPKAFFEVKVSSMALLLFAMLLDYARGKEECWPGQAELCEKLKVSPNALRRYLKELLTANLVKPLKRGWGKGNTYYLLPPKLEKT